MKSSSLRKPQTILLTADTVGGVWSYALELARALSDHGVKIILATMGAKLSRDQRRAVKTIEDIEVVQSSYKLEWMENPWSDLEAAGNWLLEVEQRWKPDLIHFNSYGFAALSFHAPKIVVGHSCVLSWWRAVKMESVPDEWNRYRDVVRRGLHAADLVVAPSRSMLADLGNLYGQFSGRTIYNARDSGIFTPGKKEDCVLAAGRIWDEAKNISALSDVAGELAWPVYIAGENRAPNGKVVKQNGSVHLGRLPSELLSKWFAKASIYALPARYEPFGLSILEAGLAGCALVLGDIPSLREIWNRAAIFVDSNDSEQLKHALQKLINNPSQRKELAAFAQCRAIQFSPQRMANDYLSAYGQVLEKRFSGKESTCVS